MTRAEDVSAAFVAEKRGMGAGWGAIARMTGAPERDLRRLHDSTWVDPSLRREADLTPRDQVRAGLVRAGIARQDAEILARLWHANGSRLPSKVLAAGIAGGGATYDVVKAAKIVAEARGVRFANTVQGFALAPEGVAAIAALAGVAFKGGKP